MKTRKYLRFVEYLPTYCTNQRLRVKRSHYYFISTDDGRFVDGRDITSVCVRIIWKPAQISMLTGCPGADPGI